MTALDTDRSVSVDMPALQQLARARELLKRARGHAGREAAQSAVRKAVEAACDAGCGWGQIGDVLGIARGNAYQKYRRKPLLGALSGGPPVRRDACGQDLAQWTQATQDLSSWARLARRRGTRTQADRAEVSGRVASRIRGDTPTLGERPRTGCAAGHRRHRRASTQGRSAPRRRGGRRAGCRRNRPALNCLSTPAGSPAASYLGSGCGSGRAAATRAPAARSCR
jgi:hypothetical protein